MTWQRKLPAPIPIAKPKRLELRTLADARAFVLKRPTNGREYWQHAAKLMIEAAEHRGDIEACARQVTFALFMDGILDVVRARACPLP